MSEESIKLLPCPFCGCIAEGPFEDEEFEAFIVRCSTCTARAHADYRPEAIVAWNVRASAPTLPRDEVTQAEVRAAFEEYRRKPYRARCESCPDSFLLSETGAAYESPHVQADFVQFAADYRSALTLPPKVSELQEALEPFAREADDWVEWSDDHSPFGYGTDITVGDLRRAKAALNALQQGQSHAG